MIVMNERSKNSLQVDGLGEVLIVNSTNLQ